MISDSDNNDIFFTCSQISKAIQEKIKKDNNLLENILNAIHQNNPYPIPPTLKGVKHFLIR
jgi:hypothetical protein